jgi:hypothetical protein
MENWIEQLNAWKSELLCLKGDDLLLHVPFDSKKVFFIDVPEGTQKMESALNSHLNFILKEQKKNQKQLGVNTLCLAKDFLQWEWEGKQRISPLYLFPIEIKVNKLKKKLVFTRDESFFINPYLDKLLFNKYAISIENLLKLNEYPENWKVISTTVVGNFHYHRFSILQDIDTYIGDENSVHSNLGVFFKGTQFNPVPVALDMEHQLFQWDDDQKKAINFLAKGNSAVVSGPPGTGKSQLIANVVFQHALAEKFVLVSSEKNSALTVILQKFEGQNLGELCLFVGDVSQNKRRIIQDLKQSWKTLESFTGFERIRDPKNHSYLLFYAQFEGKLNRLNNLPQIEEDLSLKSPNAKHANAPDLLEWRKSQILLTPIIKAYEIWKGKTLGSSAFKHIKAKQFVAKNNLLRLEKELRQAQKNLQTLQTKVPDEKMCSIENLRHLHRLCIHAQILHQDMFLQHKEIFNIDSAEHNKYKKLSRKYLKNEHELTTFSTQELKVNFSIDKWREIKAIIATQKAFSWRYYQTMKQAKKIFGVQMRAATMSALNQQIKYLELKEKQHALYADLLNLGIRHPSTDISMIDTLLLQFQKLDKGLLHTLTTYSLEKRKKLKEVLQSISQLIHFFEQHFLFSESEDLDAVVEDLLADFPFFIAHQGKFLDLFNQFPTTFHFVQKLDITDQAEQLITWNTLKTFQTNQPELFSYTGEDFKHDINELRLLATDFFREEALYFLAHQAKKMNQYHVLLNTPASKLNEEQKIFRKELRIGKAILVKEFNKQKQHLSLRELYNSPALHWIKVLKPIWLMSPLQTSEVLPNVKNMVDLVVMDEASQIPFLHALPTFYRSKQICVVGDEMQMAPSTFFISGNNERENVLGRCMFHAQTFPIHYHYRSLHPDLIAFSNRYFYNNSLHVFLPGNNTKNQGLFFHPVEGAIYTENQNPKEANALLLWLDENHASMVTNTSFMLVAFSEAQYKCICECIEHEFSQLEKLIENETLIVKTLENVQGDEADHVLISLGYAMDEQNKFHMRFGPVNHSGGDKRLNVLFSRARKSMHLFSSVHSSDFKMSSNNGVEMLRKFHELAEEKLKIPPSEQNVLDQWGVNYEIQQNTILLKQPTNAKLSLLQYLALFNVLIERAWRINITFDKDRFINN